MPNPCTVWILDAPPPRWGVRPCWVASRSLWTRQFPKRIRLSVLAPSCWPPTASARRRRSTWARSGLSLPQPDPPRNTPCICLPPHLITADVIPQLCWTRASRLSLLSQTPVLIRKFFLMGIKKYQVCTAPGALRTLRSVLWLALNQLTGKKRIGTRG